MAEEIRNPSRLGPEITERIEWAAKQATRLRIAKKDSQNQFLIQQMVGYRVARLAEAYQDSAPASVTNLLTEKVRFIERDFRQYEQPIGPELENT